jgi:DNA-3-methyladenine glycosylase
MSESHTAFREIKPEPNGDPLSAALSREFYLQDTVGAARNLLNCVLGHETGAGLVLGRITETEAYTSDDPSCHSYRGKTLRNAPMFGRPGHAYVYFTYGMHFCFNAVTAPEGIGEAVLIRAVEPMEGWELMSRRRGLAEGEIERLGTARSDRKVRERWGRALCGGPGKLCQAFGMKLGRNWADLMVPGGLWIAPPLPNIGAPRPEDITASPRIGIRRAVELPRRFTLRNDPYLSRK